MKANGRQGADTLADEIDMIQEEKQALLMEDATLIRLLQLLLSSLSFSIFSCRTEKHGYVPCLRENR